MAYRFIVQEQAQEAAGLVIQFTAAVPRRLVSLADQAVRASTSVSLNIAEARGRSGKDRRYHFGVAFASAREAAAAVGMLQSARAVDAPAAARTLQILDSVRAMLWRIMNPR
jgi:four helix bundle protein